MQFQVPQFIETEDKVVGPFSIRQFAYVGVAALVSAMLYFLVATWLFAIFAVIFIGSSLAISFIKIQGRSLISIIRSAFNFYWKPQTYIWQPEHAMIRAGVGRVVASKQKVAPIKDIPAAIASRKKWEEENAKGEEGNSTLDKLLSGDALHSAWEHIQNGSPLAKKTSASQFLEGQMAQRYQIFQKPGGDRDAARRVDYR
jgi:hypothetical protein